MKWYEISAKTTKNAETQADEVVAQVDLLDEIGFWGISAKDFIDELNAKAAGATTINMSINSPGGNVFDGLAIFNALKAKNVPINVKVLGVAASAASLIAMAGSKISMPDNTFMMIHNPWGAVVGNAEELRDTADILDKIGVSLLNTYVARTGQKPEAMAALLAKDTYMTAAEAKDLGFADEVLPSIAAKASFDLEQLPANIRAAFKAAVRTPAPAGETPEAKAAREAGEAAARVTAAAAETARLAALASSKDVVATTAMIEKAAVDAGFPEFAAMWALDAGICDAVDPVKAIDVRISTAKEIKALCVLCKQADAAKLFIAQKTPMKEVRTKLQDALASQDERTSIDSHLKITKPGENTPNNVPEMVIDTDAIYADRNKRK